MSAESLADHLDNRITTAGPIPVADYVEAALYDPTHGFITFRLREGQNPETT